MKEALRRIERQSRQIQTYGMVVAVEEDGISVDTEYGELFAMRAVSCLVEPSAGDRVLIAGDLNEDLFVIAVLESRDMSATKISVAGDLHLGIPNGRFSVASAKGLDLVSAADISVTSQEMAVHSGKGRIFFDSLSYVGSRVMAQAGAFKLVGGLFDTIAERISQKAKRSYRVVDEVDQVRSCQIDYRAEKNMRLKAQNALVSADELVKVDGGQIHLG